MARLGERVLPDIPVRMLKAFHGYVQKLLLCVSFIFFLVVPFRSRCFKTEFNARVRVVNLIVPQDGNVNRASELGDSS